MTLAGALGSPSERSALIVRASLPAGLERLRRLGVEDAADGVPAHLTLLYPFVPPERLDRAVRDRIAAIVAGHDAFDYRLVSAARWPDTVYVAVDPAARFVDLQAALAQSFPAFPIYGSDAAFEFIPHLTIAEGRAVHAPATIDDPAWVALPRPGRVAAVEVIARGSDDRWRTVWRIRLGGRRRSARR